MKWFLDILGLRRRERPDTPPVRIMSENEALRARAQEAAQAIEDRYKLSKLYEETKEKAKQAELDREGFRRLAERAEKERGQAVVDLGRAQADIAQERTQWAAKEEGYKQQITSLGGEISEAVALLRYYQDGGSFIGPIRNVSIQKIRALLPLAHLIDSVYSVPTRADWELFFANLPDYGAWVENMNDCDNYALRIIARAKDVFGNMSIGYVDCHFDSFATGKRSADRLVLVVMDDGGELKLGYFNYRPPAGAYLDARYGVPEGVFEELPAGWEPVEGEL